MSLARGIRIGPYEIVAPIGAGGMGEVFRARDAKLARDVAIKILPPLLAGDGERIVRFRREAQVLASLNHPNIAAIYGLEESGGTVALALELVAGEDLAARLSRGPIPVDEAVAIARQIAEGLEAAHEKGIIHRDLKPANVKLTPDGDVKILDFGLAKAVEGNVVSSDLSLENSPTISRHMTHAGTILGTAAYMAPEQARGKAVDKRSDIWSFGVVLFEMLSGKRLFKGETVSDTLAAVLREEPDWSALPGGTPPAVRRILERCLERDPKKRLRDIGEARLALSDPATSLLTISPAAATRSVSRRTAVAVIAAAIVLTVAASVASIAVWTRTHRTVAPLTRFTIQLPAGQVLTGGDAAVISRDGRTIAYAAHDASGTSRLYVRPLDRLESFPIPGSEGGQQPFFSPEGARIGFFARGKLMTASLSGGAPLPLADVSFQPIGGTWGEDDTIVFVPILTSGLMRIAASGGKPEQLTTPDDRAKGYGHGWPQFLPGGDAVLFTLWGNPSADTSGPTIVSLKDQKWTHVVAARHWCRYAASGHLLVRVESGIIAAARFDLAHPSLVRPHTPVLEDVFELTTLANAWMSVSDSGTLVYVPGNPFLGTMAWMDRTGHVQAIESTPSPVADLTLSPDGTKAVYETGADSLWVIDLRRGTRVRLTRDEDGVSAYPAWTRDGSRVLFASNRSGNWDIYSVPSSGGAATRVLTRKGNQLPLSAAPDGTILFSDRSRGTSTDLWMLSPRGEVRPFVVSGSSKVCATFAPDGRTVAYVSDESGRDEVYMRSVVRPEEGVAVSVDGGSAPRWSADGKEIFYRRGDAFWAATVTTDGPLSAGDSRVLFETRAAWGRSSNHPGYGVSPDGTRFLIQIPDPRAIPTHINVVLNWSNELTAKVPH